VFPPTRNGTFSMKRPRKLSSPSTKPRIAPVRGHAKSG